MGTSYTKNIYFQYFNIGNDAYRDKVHFYEDNFNVLNNLYFEERIEIDIDYLFCLFEIGRYERFLNKVESILQEVIIENIFNFNGYDVFQELLFRKAASFYQLKSYSSSKKVLEQLIKISGTNHLYIGLFTLCERKLKRHENINLKASAMASLIFFFIISILQVFFGTYIASQQDFLFWSKVFLVTYSAVVLIGLEVLFQKKVFDQTAMFTSALMNTVYYKTIKTNQDKNLKSF